jgi:hypothetical protein
MRDEQGAQHLLALDASDEALGVALLNALGHSRFVLPDGVKESGHWIIPEGATTQVSNQSQIVGDSGEVFVYGPNLKSSVVSEIQSSGTKVFTNLNDFLLHIKSKG